jgi:hypothetical protein
MALDDEYAAIGIDLRAARNDIDPDAPADNPVEKKLGRSIVQLLDLMLRGDSWLRAKARAARQLNRRRIA